MIFSRTPYRISFFGGGSDYPIYYEKYGGEVISASIDKYLYIFLRDLPNYYNFKYRTSYSIIEQEKKLDNLKHPVFRNALKLLKIKKGVEISYMGEIPASSGMGSSSACVVGTINAMNFYQNKNLSKKELAKKSILFEQNILKENVGSQDQIVCSYGGFNNIIFKKNHGFEVKRIKNPRFKYNLSKNSLLVFTGKQRHADKIVKSYIKKLDNKKKNNIDKILQYLNDAKNCIIKNDIEEFGKLLRKSWIEKKNLSPEISSNEIDKLINLGIENDSCGEKLLGAGGGGFVYFIFPNQHTKEKFKKKISKKYSYFDVNFTDNGSEVKHL